MTDPARIGHYYGQAVRLAYQDSAPAAWLPLLQAGLESSQFLLQALVVVVRDATTIGMGQIFAGIAADLAGDWPEDLLVGASFWEAYYAALFSRGAR